jgi:hypothetical protein
MRCDQVSACAAAGKFNTEPGKPIGRFLPKNRIAFEGNRIMAASIRSFTFIALICASTTGSWAQAQQSGPSSQQPATPRQDPATVGAGPTSSAPGQTNYDPPKGAPVTTDDRGVTTTNSPSQPSTGGGGRRDQGNESYDAAPDSK